MVPTPIQNEKNTLRHALRNLRDSIDQELRQEKSCRIAALLCENRLFRAAGTVMLYASVRGEADTGMLIDNCLKRQVRTVLPAVDKTNAKLLLYQILSRAELVPGGFGIPEPDGADKVPLLPSALEFVVVPGVAFDVTGARIGYGKGYYDKLLAGITVPTAGICFEEQLVAQIPCEPHDRRVTMIVTEKRIIYCHGYQEN